MAAEKYHGSCACRKVRFEVMLDLSKGTFKRNCSYCARVRWWAAMVKPEDVSFLSGEGELATFARNWNHQFCKQCGIKLFGHGEVPQAGKLVAINLAALDDLSPVDWVRAPVRYVDGRNDRWGEEPEFKAHM